MRYMAHMIGVPVVLFSIALALLTVSSLLFVERYLLELGLYLYYISLVCCVAAIGVQLHNCRRIWQATHGIGHMCEECGTPATRKNGPNGPYLQCWQCGRNRAISVFDTGTSSKSDALR